MILALLRFFKFSIFLLSKPGLLLLQWRPVSYEDFYVVFRVIRAEIVSKVVENFLLLHLSVLCTLVVRNHCRLRSGHHLRILSFLLLGRLLSVVLQLVLLLLPKLSYLSLLSRRAQWAVNVGSGRLDNFLNGKGVRREEVLLGRVELLDLVLLGGVHLMRIQLFISGVLVLVWLVLGVWLLGISWTWLLVIKGWSHMGIVPPALVLDLLFVLGLCLWNCLLLFRTLQHLLLGVYRVWVHPIQGQLSQLLFWFWNYDVAHLLQLHTFVHCLERHLELHRRNVSERFERFLVPVACLSQVCMRILLVLEGPLVFIFEFLDVL